VCVCVCVCACVRVPAPPPHAAQRTQSIASAAGAAAVAWRLHARERRGAADHRGEHVEPALCDELGLQGRMYHMCICSTCAYITDTCGV
jgi:hypothetical protein